MGSLPTTVVIVVPRPRFAMEVDVTVIDDCDMPDLLDWIAVQGIRITTETIDPNSIRPHWLSRLKAVPDSEIDLRTDPVLVSRDGFLLDGLERWELYNLFGAPLDVIRLGVDYRDAFRIIQDFQTYYPA
jgi:hypothetical protein